MDVSLAAWLRSQLKRKLSLAKFVQGGIGLLTEAAFFANVGRRVSAGPAGERMIPVRPTDLVEPPGLRSKVTPKDERLWFNDERAQVFADRFDHIFHGLPQRAGLSKVDLERSPARFPHLLFGNLCDAVPYIIERHPSPANAAEVANALCGLARPTNRSTHRGDTGGSLQSTPQELLLAAYRALRDRAGEERLGHGDFQALLLLGFSGQALSAMRPCAFCFRWAAPPSKLCAQHGLSKSTAGTRLERQARYQAGRRVALVYRQDLRTAHRELNFLDCKSRAFVVARRLWYSSLPDEKRTISALFRQLEQLPHVREKLGMDAGAGRPLPSELIELLRVELDPLEYRPGAWMDKLSAAERWFAAEKTATPGSRGVGKRTSYRVMTALLSFDRKHPSSQADLAERAGVSPSALSHWKRNRAEEPITKQLIERIEAEKQPLQAERRRLRRGRARWLQMTKSG